MKAISRIVLAGGFMMLMLLNAGVAGENPDGTMAWGADEDSAFLGEMLARYEVAPFIAQPTIEATESYSARGLGTDVIKIAKKRAGQIQKMMEKRSIPVDPGISRKTAEIVGRFKNRALTENMEDGMAAVMIDHSLEVINMALPALVRSGDEEIRDLAKDVIVERVTYIDKAKYLPRAMEEDRRMMEPPPASQSEDVPDVFLSDPSMN